jgi:hypothetical protein
MFPTSDRSILPRDAAEVTQALVASHLLHIVAEESRYFKFIPRQRQKKPPKRFDQAWGGHQVGPFFGFNVF